MLQSHASHSSKALHSRYNSLYRYVFDFLAQLHSPAHTETHSPLSTTSLVKSLHSSTSVPSEPVLGPVVPGDEGATEGAVDESSTPSLEISSVLPPQPHPLQSHAYSTSRF